MCFRNHGAYEVIYCWESGKCNLKPDAEREDNLILGDP